jgi:hypothetical protein
MHIYYMAATQTAKIEPHSVLRAKNPKVMR